MHVLDPALRVAVKALAVAVCVLAILAMAAAVDDAVAPRHVDVGEQVVGVVEANRRVLGRVPQVAGLGVGAVVGVRGGRLGARAVDALGIDEAAQVAVGVELADRRAPVSLRLLATVVDAGRLLPRQATPVVDGLGDAVADGGARAGARTGGFDSGSVAVGVIGEVGGLAGAVGLLSQPRGGVVLELRVEALTGRRGLAGVPSRRRRLRAVTRGVVGVGELLPGRIDLAVEAVQRVVAELERVAPVRAQGRAARSLTLDQVAVRVIAERCDLATDRIGRREPSARAALLDPAVEPVVVERGRDVADAVDVLDGRASEVAVAVVGEGVNDRVAGLEGPTLLHDPTGRVVADLALAQVLAGAVADRGKAHLAVVGEGGLALFRQHLRQRFRIDRREVALALGARQLGRVIGLLGVGRPPALLAEHWSAGRQLGVEVGLAPLEALPGIGGVEALPAPVEPPPRRSPGRARRAGVEELVFEGMPAGVGDLRRVSDRVTLVADLPALDLRLASVLVGGVLWAPDAGGRTQPVVSGFRGLVRPEGSDEDVAVELKPREGELSPGTQGEADLWFLLRAYKIALAVSQGFELREGATQIGEGRVLSAEAG